MMFGDDFLDDEKGLGLYLVFESENIGGCSVALFFLQSDRKRLALISDHCFHAKPVAQ
ncbi:hypothetical protein AABM38_01790 [Heyndrickxia sp. MSNUG]|uniref:hypothetical protein n=1 Tax=Heyndrickxia sp. MSNUG TaxID=3136677 RepID=UPI003C2D9795